MKIRNLYIYGLLLLFCFGCTEESVDFLPINQITIQEVIASPDLLQNVITGNYAFFSRGEGKYGYDRTRYDTQEYMSDDIIMMRWSGNSFSYTLTYQPTPISGRALDLWQKSYRAINSFNVVIEALDKFEESGEMPIQEINQLKGETLWMRAMFHWDLVRVFGRPYSHDSPEINLGVPLCKNAVGNEGISRATVKETYEFIERDLLEAAELMHEDKANIFVSKEVALAALARLYLFMENNEKSIEYADKVINSGRYDMVNSETFPRFNRLGPERNPEIIFAVKIRLEDITRGKYSMGGMMHGDGGYGEIMVSSSYLDLLFKNKNDLRINFIDPQFKLDENGNKIPDPDEPYYGYAMNDRMGVPTYWMTKLTYEYDLTMLHSPVYFRLAEMYLIKAEAYAKTNQNEKALEMVNMIRERAELSGDQLFRLDNLQGYESVLDIVLDEKRLEFAFEMYRAHDVFRNKRTMDRSYMSWQGWSGPSYISYTSNRILHQIPQDEIIKNPNLKQNPSYTD